METQGVWRMARPKLLVTRRLPDAVEARIRRDYDALLNEQTGVRITQVTMLVVLYLAGPQTINDMAERLGLDRTTLTRNLKLLEREGLVTITAGDDARVREVSLTDAAQEQLASAHKYWRKAQTHMADAMGAEGVRRLLRDLSGAVEAARSE